MKTSIVLFLVACGSATGPAIPDAEHVTATSIAVTPATLTTKRGLDEPTQLSAKVTLSNQVSADVTYAATWSSSNSAVVTVSASGLATPVGAGLATITATYEGANGTAAVTAVSPKIYMAEANGTPGVSVFDAYGNGDNAPVQAINGATTTISFPWSVQVVDDEIYVSDPSANSISVWPVTATGNVAPTRQLKGALTLLTQPYAMAVYNHEIYAAVTNGGVGSIVVFPHDATGNVAPTRTITGPSTTLGANSVFGLAVYKDEIYVTQLTSKSVLVFPKGATGDTAPTRTISGALTGFNQIESLSVSNDEIFTSNLSDVRVFATSATGNVAPVRAIAGPESGIGNNVISAVVLGQELITATYTGSPTNGAIHVYPRNASSDIAPTRTIAGTMSTILGPRLITIY